MDALTPRTDADGFIQAELVGTVLHGCRPRHVGQFYERGYGPHFCRDTRYVDVEEGTYGHHCETCGYLFSQSQIPVAIARRLRDGLSRLTPGASSQSMATTHLTADVNGETVRATRSGMPVLGKGNQAR